MNTNKIVQLYKREEIETAPKHKLLFLLHRRCLFLLEESIRENKILTKRLLLNKAQNILSFLEQSLNLSDKGALSLFFLYDYCYCLLELNENSTISKAHKVLSILSSVWR